MKYAVWPRNCFLFSSPLLQSVTKSQSSSEVEVLILSRRHNLNSLCFSLFGGFQETRRLFHYTIWWHFILAPKCGVFLTSFHVLITAILWGPVWIFQETGSVLLWWGDVGSQTQGWGVCPCLGKSLEPTCSLKPNGRLEQWVRLLHLESDH